MEYKSRDSEFIAADLDFRQMERRVFRLVRRIKWLGTGLLMMEWGVE